jgi:ferrous iron transport protein B
VVVQAHKGVGIEQLKRAIGGARGAAARVLDLKLPEVMQTHVGRLRTILVEEKLVTADQAAFDAHLMLSMGDDEDMTDLRRGHPRVQQELQTALAACEQAEVDPIGAEIEAHYAFIGEVVAECVSETTGGEKKAAISDRIDRVLTHKVWGLLTFVAIMTLVFVSIFKFAKPLMDAINGDSSLVSVSKHFIDAHMADGPLKSLLNDGVIAGVGNVVAFLPQIAMLFLFLSILEDSGYMSRAAFLMDRIMSRVGLHGKSFIPLLSGFACAVPAIMGTRVIENRRDRLATILILPLMSCSARLPVYMLVIAAFFGKSSAWAQGAILLAMYALGTLSAFALAWLFKRTLLKGPAPAFIMEMPPYHLPHWKTVSTSVWHRCWHFLKRAGTLIFAFSVIMWAATHYPKPASFSQDYAGQIQALDMQNSQSEKQLRDLGWAPENEPQPALAITKEQAGEKESLLAARAETLDQIDTLKNQRGAEVLEHSIAGRVGRAIAPVFKPLGYDWKLSIAVTGAFFAREVIVSTMGIVYSVGEVDENSVALQRRLAGDYSALVGISLMVFVVFCMQCLSTLAVAKREMGHWGWPAFMFVYMTGLAYVAALVVYQGGLMLGFH